MHLIILYCRYIWSNAHYYGLVWVGQIISTRVVPRWNNSYANCLYLFLCFCHGIDIKSNHFKSNHFYCHITTAHVPWWVKFLRACSRQCRNNLHIDSTYLQTYTEDNVQNTHTYSQYTQCTIRHTYSYQYTFYTVSTHSTLCTHIN